MYSPRAAARVCRMYKGAAEEAEVLEAHSSRRLQRGRTHKPSHVLRERA